MRLGATAVRARPRRREPRPGGPHPCTDTFACPIILKNDWLWTPDRGSHPQVFSLTQCGSVREAGQPLCGTARKLLIAAIWAPSSHILKTTICKRSAGASDEQHGPGLSVCSPAAGSPAPGVHVRGAGRHTNQLRGPRRVFVGCSGILLPPAGAQHAHVHAPGARCSGFIYEATDHTPPSFLLCRRGSSPRQSSVRQHPSRSSARRWRPPPQGAPSLPLPTQAWSPRRARAAASPWATPARMAARPAARAGPVTPRGAATAPTRLWADERLWAALEASIF